MIDKDRYGRVCAKCGGDPQPWIEFAIDRQQPTGHHSYCKTCCRAMAHAYNKKYYAAHRERIRAAVYARRHAGEIS